MLSFVLKDCYKKNILNDAVNMQSYSLAFLNL